MTVDGNTIADPSESPILAYSKVYAGYTNTVADLTIADNTFNIDAGLFTATYNMIDLRNVGGTNSLTGNSLTLSGSLPPSATAIRAIGIRGSQTGTIDITGNTLDGGGVTHNGSTTIYVTGIVILSNDPTTGASPRGRSSTSPTMSLPVSKMASRSATV